MNDADVAVKARKIPIETSIVFFFFLKPFGAMKYEWLGIIRSNAQ